MLFSSPNIHSSFENPTSKAFFPSKTIQHDKSSNDTINSLYIPRNASNGSTSTSMKGLNGSRLIQKCQLKKKISHSPVSFSSIHYETGRSTEGSEVAETEDLCAKFEESDLEVVKKKLKTENDSLFTDFLSDSNSRALNMDQISEDAQGSLLEADDSNGKDEYKFWVNDTEPAHKEYSDEEFKTAVDLLNKKYSNKHEDQLNANKTVSYVFYTAPETFSSSQSDQTDHSDDEKISSLKFKTNGSETFNGISATRTRDTKQLSIQLGSPESLKEGQQILRDTLKSITSADIQRLEPEVYLNDNLLNFYLKLIEHGFLSEERKKKCHFFNTYFMAKMIQLFAEVGNDFSKFSSVYQKMGKWTKKVNIFEKDFLFIPINENEHWNLLVLCYPNRLFSKDESLPFVVCLDSICRMDNKNVKMLYQFFSRDLRAKLPKESEIFNSKVKAHSLTTFPYFQPMVPKQSNSTDCGLYMVHYIEMFAEDESYILGDKEDMQKMKWFPRKAVCEKRRDMKKLIENLKSDRFQVINEYLHRRSRRMTEYETKKDQFDSFSQQGFERALAKTYPKQNLNEQERNCLMLDYYYFGTLDFEQMSSNYRQI